LPNLFLGFPVPRAKIASMIEGAAPPLEHASWHKPPGSDPIVLPADISSGQLVKWNGTKFIGVYEPSPGGKDPFTALIYHTLFDSIDGIWQEKTGSAQILLSGNGVVLDTQTTANSGAKLRKLPYYLIHTPTWSKQRKLKTKARVIHSGTGSITCIIMTGEHIEWIGFGFSFGLTTLDGVTYNGSGNMTSRTLETLPSAPYDVTRTLEAIFYPGVKIDFYVDGVLKNTATTNLPTGTTRADELLWARVLNESAQRLQLYLSEWACMQEI